MSTFLGIGLGPIQTGIFLAGAAGRFDRVVIAEVDEELKRAISSDGGTVVINIADGEGIETAEFAGIEVLNPTNEGDIPALESAAAEADEAATALPGVKFFDHIVPWLIKGFSREPRKHRLIYTAENHNRAAEILAEKLGDGFPETHCLNTVVGKMSGIISAAECAERGLSKLSPSADRGHLVEEFDKIYVSRAPGIEDRLVAGLHTKNDLYPFEEAKLYGHNAIHFMLAMLGKQRGVKSMNEMAEYPDDMTFARGAFINESGAALCRKWNGVDELFTPAGFQYYAEDLLKRMTNPYLTDTIDRVTRDLSRKLGWEDRVVGTMRLVLEQGVEPERIAVTAKHAGVELFGDDEQQIAAGLAELWPSPWTDEHQKILDLILHVTLAVTDNAGI